MKKILVIDDNEDAADMLGALLEFDGHVVSTAYGGRAGLAAVIATQPDIVFLDIGMPEINGYQVAAEIRRFPLTRQPCLIAFTAWNDAATVEKARQAGFNQHVTKASTIETLRSVVKGVSLKDPDSARLVSEWLGSI
jgi:two-component system CheB/CheR fusion protein